MLHSHDRQSIADTRRQSAKARSSACVMFMAILVVFAAALVSSRSVVSASRSTERSNSRVTLHKRLFAGIVTANSTTLSPLASITVDRTDDNAGASACTASANDCSLRGAVAFANLNPGTTINLPAGTYQLSIAGTGEGFNGNNSIGDLDVTANNTSIIGAGSSTTTIQQTQANDRVLEVNPFLDAGFNFSISGVTVSGGQETTGVGGGGIISGSINNTTSVSGCIISGNSATGAGTAGGGGMLNTGGNLTVSGTAFATNTTPGSGGGLAYTAGDPIGRTPSTGALNVSGSTFNGNSSSSTAGGGGGADLFDSNSSIGTYSINSSSFTSNTASAAGGGAITVESGPLTLSTSSLTGNSALFGGAIRSSGSVAVTYSRLVGNSTSTAANGLTFFKSGGAFSAEDNWWGSNSGPASNDFRAPDGTISPLGYLQLRISATPNTVCGSGSTAISADIKQKSGGGALTTQLNGLPAFPVPAGTIFTATSGTLSNASTQFVDGAASATLTAGTTSATINAVADNQTVMTSVTLSNISVTVNSPSVCASALPATMTATVSGASGSVTYSWTGPGGFTSTANPISVSTPGTYNVTVTDGSGCTAAGSGTLTVHQNPTVSVNSATACPNSPNGTLTATVSGGTGPYTFSWTGPGGFTSSSNPINVTAAGTYNVTVTDTNLCTGAGSGTFTLSDTQPPSITCPANITVEPTSPSGAVVTYTAPVGTDNCPNPVTARTAGLASGATFPIGTTTVTYTVTDASNNSTSCSFTVTVRSASQVVQDLINRVQALQPPLSGQQSQGLVSKLNAALTAINSGQINVACNKLNDFISQVSGFINNGTLTSAQGQPLINSANNARAALGCN